MAFQLLPKRLNSQLILIVTFILLATSLSFSFIVSSRQVRTASKALQKNAQIMVNNLSLMSAHRLIVGDYSSLEQFLLQSAELPSILEIKIFDKDLVSVVHIQHPPGEKSLTVVFPKSEHIPEITKMTVFKESREMIIWQPIIAGKLQGWIKVVFSTDEISSMQKGIWKYTFWVTLLWIIISATLLILFLRPAINAIEKISAFARDLDKNKGKQTAIDIPSREISQLADSLNSASMELSKTETALQEEREKMALILQSLGEGIIVIDEKFKVISANKAFYEMFKIPPDSIIDKTCYEQLHNKDRPCYELGENFICAVERTFATGKPYAAGITHVDISGIEMFLDIRSFPITDEQGKVVSVIETFFDITENKKLEGQLRQAQKLEAIGTLAGGIAHDFNNILSAILGYSDLALMKKDGDPSIRNDIQAVLKAGNRAKDLVMQILSFSRQTEKNLQDVRPHLLVKEVAKLLRASIPAFIEFRIECDPESGSVRADPTHIHQLIMNLCTNAYHAMQENGGVLGIKVGNVYVDEANLGSTVALQQGNYLIIEVSDTGCGIDPDLLEKIFDPYFTTKEKGKGTGLGLSVVQGLVKNYGGEISIYSIPGKGSTFKVYLPRIDKPYFRDELGRADALPMPVGSERLLIVDDEESIATLMGEILKTLGYRVSVCTDGLEALELFQVDPQAFDLVITDLAMPRMSGSELIEKMRSMNPDLKIILYTGLSQQVNAEKFVELTVHYLMKPVSNSVLATTIRNALDEN